MTIDNDNPIWDMVDKWINIDSSKYGIQKIDDFPSLNDCSFCNNGKPPVAIDGLIMCTDCNSIIDRLIDYGAEWRYYNCENNVNSGVNTTRCCPPSNSLLPTLGSIVTNGHHGHKNTYIQSNMQKKTVLLTNNRDEDVKNVINNASNIVDSDQHDINGVVKDGGDTCTRWNTNTDTHRYYMWNSMTYRERSLCSVFEQLSLIALRNGIPQIILEEAKCLYKRVSSVKVTRGDNRKALVACSMYMACKLNKVPRSTKEVAEIFGVQPRVITKGCKLFQESVDLDVESSHPGDYIRRFCSRLHMDYTETEFTEQIVSHADNMNIVCDFIPTSVVAGAIYMTSTELNIGLSKLDIANICHISEMTLTKCYNRLVQSKHELLKRVMKDDPSRSM